MALIYSIRTRRGSVPSGTDPRSFQFIESSANGAALKNAALGEEKNTEQMQVKKVIDNRTRLFILLFSPSMMLLENSAQLKNRACQ